MTTEVESTKIIWDSKEKESEKAWPNQDFVVDNR